MSLTWRRASKASFVTTFTTAVAFLANVFSKLMPIKTFGLFATIMVPMNYFLVIAVYPAVLIIHERYFNWMFAWCWRTVTGKGKKKVSSKDEIPEEDIVENDEEVHESKPSLLVRFFGGPYMTFLKYARWFIIPLVLLWVAFAGWRVSKMEALSEEEQWFPDSHPI